ncbi:hypothetical protein E2C01_098011 [Portunus trituberculatus]|uniref:Uncharacterized protein n=1 Tax=Portunus trituberculatus TaxID=210409 RepID=A0A5B7KB19_PORTR|nr:hypothetical protein [Portunus trituberculatus]
MCIFFFFLKRLNNRRRHDVTKVKPARYWSAAAPFTQNISNRSLKIHDNSRVKLKESKICPKDLKHTGNT